jgi:hypothetical protein
MDEEYKYLELKRLDILEKLTDVLDDSDRLQLEIDLINIETYFKINKHKI